MPKFLEELLRRKVPKVAIAYLIGGWLVIQIAETIFPNIGLPDTAITLVIGIVAAGFPLAIILSWVFDATSKGVVLTESKSDIGPSIAVIPFPDMSAEQDQEHFCDGLTEELLNVLTCIPNLRVASRTSSFSLKGKQTDLKDVAEKLNVRHILEGSVRKSGNRIRVTAQLIDASTDTHLWSETYDRELDDIFAIQDDIAACILQKLKLKLGPTRSASEDTNDPKAYEYFLRGRGYALVKSDRDVQLAAEMFLKAVELDPDFLRAWVHLSEMCTIHAVFFDSDERWLKWSKLAGTAVERIKPGSAESFLAKGYAHMTCREFPEAEEQFRKAVVMDQTLGNAHHYLARAQVHQGNRAEAAASFVRATECDDEDFDSPTLAANSYLGLGDQESAAKMSRIALTRIEKVLEDYPDNQRAYYFGSLAHEVLNNFDTARLWTEKALSLNPSDPATRYNAACFFIKVGEIDRAFDLLEGSISSRNWAKNDPDLDSIREHARYEPFLESLLP